MPERHDETGPRSDRPRTRGLGELTEDAPRHRVRVDAVRPVVQVDAVVNNPNRSLPAQREGFELRLAHELLRRATWNTGGTHAPCELRQVALAERSRPDPPHPKIVVGDERCAIACATVILRPGWADLVMRDDRRAYAARAGARFRLTTPFFAVRAAGVGFEPTNEHSPVAGFQDLVLGMRALPARRQPGEADHQREGWWCLSSGSR
jgi:hypothetical protein